MNNIHTFARWQVKDGELDGVLDLLEGLARESRLEAGNLLYEVFQSNTEPNTIILHEAYADEAALEIHRDSAHYQNIAAAKILPLLQNRMVDITSALVVGK